MIYLKFIFLIILIEYLLLIFHELIHIFSGKLLKLNLSYIYIYPFVIIKNDNKYKLSLTKKILFTSTTHTKFESINIIDEKDYKIKLKLLQKHLLSSYIFDLIIFLSFFLIGLIKVNLAILTIISIFHFILVTLNFFSFDGKYAIGSMEDERIAFNLILHFTLLCDGYIDLETKLFIKKKYINISNSILIEKFNVNDLWNYTNNLAFFKYHLILRLNDIFTMDDNNLILFVDMIYNEYKTINILDFRQCKETSEFLILYYILLYINKLTINNFFYDNSLILEKCHPYFINLYKQTKTNIKFNNFIFPKEFAYTNQEKNLFLTIINKI